MGAKTKTSLCCFHKDNKILRQVEIRQGNWSLFTSKAGGGIVHSCDRCGFKSKFFFSILAPAMKESMSCQVIRLQVEIKQGNWGHSFSISKAGLLPGGGKFYTQGDICFHSINTPDKSPSKNLKQVDMNSMLERKY